MADLLSFKAEALKAVPLVYPGTEDYFGITVNIRGMESAELKAVQQRQRQENLKSGRGIKLSAAKLDKQSDELLVAAIVSWTFEEDFKGEQATLGDDPNPKCDDKNKMKLVKSLFGRQIDEALEDEKAFIEAS